ncbi:MAG: PstS family phosphate ABC transporter substrate-binding protein [Myxococcales bacterium]|nr:PstS family phosphate ABC transporter substrate-binding protein [Myxococcales bacterium]MDD9964660.1 PstS family phosphate ABC transporter substrate-binding protein [Myxococcales bacterium]
MRSVLGALAGLCLSVVIGCSKHSARPSDPPPGASKGDPTSGEPMGAISIDGSSTVFPITEAVAEEFEKGSDVNVLIGVSGTGGGFKKFCKGETAISGASRPVKESEIRMCKQAGIEFTELPVAYDGIAVVVHKQATWIDSVTVDELKTLWAPEAQGKVTKWNQIRSDWPDKEVHLFGPGVDSGTYDYFTQAIVGTEHASRGDFTSSEDDNVLVQGVSTDPLALGFFGFAYYAENKSKLKLVGVDDGNQNNGAGAIAPDSTTIADGTYQPLSRPIFIYVSSKYGDKKAVREFITYYLTKGAALVKETGYIPLPKKAYDLALQRFEKGVRGSAFSGGSKVGVTVEQLLTGG